MRSLSSLGIGLSLVFGFLLLALIAELYYVLWWKRRIINREIEEDEYKFLYLFCWKKPTSLSSSALNPVRMTDTQSHESENHQLHLHTNSSKDFLLKPYGEDGTIETELMRLHNLSGPPRFLFTIKEETKEDLESEDGRKGSRGRSLSDILINVETPFLTPLSSPALFTPPHTPVDTYNNHGFNPLFESSTDAEMNSIKASPPPKFKFLKDAEEKLRRRMLMEEKERRAKRLSEFVEDNKIVTPPFKVNTEEDGSYITILVSKNQERELHHPHHHHSSSSQVLPLSSSPSAIRTINKKPHV